MFSRIFVLPKFAALGGQETVSRAEHNIPHWDSSNTAFGTSTEFHQHGSLLKLGCNSFSTIYPTRPLSVSAPSLTVALRTHYRALLGRAEPVHWEWDCRSRGLHYASCNATVGLKVRWSLRVASILAILGKLSINMDTTSKPPKK